MPRVQCPNCERKLEVKVPPRALPGMQVQVTCKCDTRLRFRVPQPAEQPVLYDVLSAILNKRP